MKIVDSGYTKNTLRERLHDDWYFEDSEYEKRITLRDKNSNDHILIQYWDDNTYLVQPMVESSSITGFSAENSNIGKYQSESLDDAIDHALDLVNNSDEIY